jgi:hypothetical protein
MKMRARLVVGASLVVAATIGAVVWAGAERKTPAGTAANANAGGAVVELRVPHATGNIVLDGDTDDPGWSSPARTGAFLLANGAPARPYSDARLTWGDGHLYVALYAADEDVRARTADPDGPLWLDDAFRLVFARDGVEYAIEVSPRGTITDAARRAGGTWDYSWSSGAHVSHELDGTMNDSNDQDEEWVIEMAIPFDALGMKGERGETIAFSVRRCDTLKSGPRVCASWGDGDPRGQLVIE